MSKQPTPQQQRVLTYLETHGTIEPMTALNKLGIYRLSDVIFKLREDYEIETKPTKSLNRFKEKVSYATYIFKGVK